MALKQFDPDEWIHLEDGWIEFWSPDGFVQVQIADPGNVIAGLHGWLEDLVQEVADVD